MSASVLKLSHLLELRVEDEDGRRLGRVQDVRVRRETAGGEAEPPQYRVEGLIVGPRGLRVRLGWRRRSGPAPVAEQDALPWEDVLAIEPDRLLVRRRG